MKRLAVAFLAALLSLTSQAQTLRPTQIRGISSDTVYGTGGLVANGSPTITTPTLSGTTTAGAITASGDITGNSGKLYLNLSGVPQLYLNNTSGTTKNTQVVHEYNGTVAWRTGVDVGTNNGSNTYQFYLEGTGTVATLTSGGINGTLGATTPAAATVTTLTASGSLSLTGLVDHYMRGGAALYWNSTGASGGTTYAYIQATTGSALSLSASGGISLLGAATVTGTLSSTSMVTATALTANGAVAYKTVARATTEDAQIAAYASNGSTLHGLLNFTSSGLEWYDATPTRRVYVTSSTATFSPSGVSNGIIIGKTGTGSYGLLTLNADTGLNTSLGMFGGDSGDPNTLYMQAPAAGGVVQRVGGNAITSASTSGFSLGAYSLLWNEGGVRSWTLGVATVSGKLTLTSGDGLGTFRVGMAAEMTSTLTVNGNPPTAGQLGVVGASGGVSLALSDNVHNSMYVKHSAGNVVIGTDSGGGLTLGTNGFTPAITIDSSQNVSAASTVDAATGYKVNGGSTLSNYTEGTCTLGYRGSSTAGTFTYGTQLCRYQRVGNRVTFDFDLVLSSISGGPAGNTEITGLPVTPANTSNAYAVCTVSGYSITHSSTYSTIQLWVDPNTTTMRLLEAGNIGGSQQYSALPISAITSTASLRGVCNYQV